MTPDNTPNPAENKPQPNGPCDNAESTRETPKPGRTYNHDLLRQPQWQAACRKEFPLTACVLIDQTMLDVFGPFEDAARRYKTLVKRLGTLATVLMVVAFSGAIAGVYGMALSNPVLPHWATRAVEGSAVVGLLLACLVARWGPLRHRWLHNRFCAEVLRVWHFRQVLSGGFVDQVIAGNRSAAETAFRPSLASVQESFEQALTVSLSQLVKLGTHPIEGSFEPRLPSDPAVAKELLCAYDKLRVTHQDKFFHERANNLFADFAGCSNALWVTVVRALTGLTLTLGLVASFVTIFFHAAIGWTPLVVTACTVLGIGSRSWGEGMRFEEEQDHYLRMHSRYCALKERWDHASTARAKLQVAEDLENTAIAELRSFLQVHERSQFIV